VPSKISKADTIEACNALLDQLVTEKDAIELSAMLDKIAAETPSSDIAEKGS
jgi:hypothetical protein